MFLQALSPVATSWFDDPELPVGESGKRRLQRVCTDRSGFERSNVSLLEQGMLAEARVLLDPSESDGGFHKEGPQNKPNYIMV